MDRVIMSAVRVSWVPTIPKTFRMKPTCVSLVSGEASKELSGFSGRKFGSWEGISFRCW
jgi:hypothetical protein